MSFHLIKTPGNSDNEIDSDDTCKKSYVEELCEENSARTGILEEEIRELRQALVACQEQLDAMAAKLGNSERRDAMVASSTNGMVTNKMGKCDSLRSNGADGNVTVRPTAVRAVPRRQRMRHPYDPIRLCHFCEQPGYSDSCRNVISVVARVQTVQRKKHCPKCLKPHVGVCRKITPCAYCQESSHHRSLCPTVTAYEKRAARGHHC